MAEKQTEFKACAEFVVMQGGPRDTWAYTAHSAEQCAKSALYFDKPWPYIPTGRVETFTYSDKSNAIHPYEAEIWLYDKSKDHHGTANS
jgi:hypothetical protein